MMKTAFVAACVLAVSGSVAFAQSQLSIGGANEAPFGANGDRKSTRLNSSHRT